MVFNSHITKANRLVFLAVFILLSSFFFNGFAVAQADTSKKLLLAAVEKNADSRRPLKKCNVIFPQNLKGNEVQTLAYIQKFCAGRKGYLQRMYTRGKAYLPKVATVLKKYDLPQELKILLTLESAYNANAVSCAGAVGYWQIMDEVAKEYGMKYIARVTEAEKKKLLKLKNSKKGKPVKALAKLKDDRKNFNAATLTAARYLRDRKRNLDDNLLLIVASYNCGVGNVWQAMKRTDKASPTFWDIKKYLPAETRTYVMNFITLNVVFNNYELFAKNKLNFYDEQAMVPAA